MKWLIVVLYEVVFWIVGGFYLGAFDSVLGYGLFWIIGLLSGLGVCHVLGITKER